MLLHLHLDLPHIQVLHLCALPVLHKPLQFLEAIFGEFWLLLAPTQVPGEVIACSKRNDGEMNQLGIDTILGDFRDNPHDSSISSADNSNNWHILLRELFEMIKALISVGPHVVEVNTEELPT